MQSLQKQLLQSSIWPADKLNIAMEILAQKAGLTVNSEKLPCLPINDNILENQTIDRWMEFASNRLKIDTMQMESTYADLEKKLCFAVPSIIHIKVNDFSGFIAVLKGGKQKVKVIQPNFEHATIGIDIVRNALTDSLEKEILPPVQKILDEANIPENRRYIAQSAIIREQLSDKIIDGIWLLRLSAGADFKQQICHAGISFQFLSILSAHCIGHLLLILSWWVIARQATVGHFERHAMIAWALLLICMIPFQVLDKWSQNVFALSIGSLFKQRLLHGILQLEPEEVRHQGSGQFLGTIMEAESFGSLAMEGGMLSVVAVLELLFAFWILFFGAGGFIHAFLLLVWIAFAALVCLKYYKKAQQWINEYRNMTNDMVERMVGYRTRLVQENPLKWHAEEENILFNYTELSKKLDDMGTIIQGIVGQAWVVFSIPVLLYAFLKNTTGIGVMAMGVGGTLLAAQAFTQFSISVIRTIQVLAAWENLKPLLNTAERINQSENKNEFMMPFTLDKASASERYPLMSINNLAFRYQKELPLVLKPFTQQIDRHDRILIEGPSGSGKSTLSALLSALRQSDVGELLLWGFDLKRVGKNLWRRRVVIAPQFHENHVLTETFAFNVLMSRRWPPLNKDIEEALTICKALGLDHLLNRMPAGFLQMVGEGGWQLSHGERSRLFIARALLQNADLIILDESFGALDPENMTRCLTFVFEHSKALIVIAHP